MPKQVDAEVRREEILSAAYWVLEEEGLPGLSFRSVAARLGGSATLVTHYYSSRQSLVDDLIAFSLDQWKEQLDTLEMGIDDPGERLRVLLQWLLPIDPEGLREERARLNLLANHYDGETRAMLGEWERYGRNLLRRHLQTLITTEGLDDAVEILLMAVYGISLSAVQSPSAWPRRRQLRALEIQLGLLGLGR